MDNDKVVGLIRNNKTGAVAKVTQYRDTWLLYILIELPDGTVRAISSFKTTNEATDYIKSLEEFK